MGQAPPRAPVPGPSPRPGRLAPARQPGRDAAPREEDLAPRTPARPATSARAGREAGAREPPEPEPEGGAAGPWERAPMARRLPAASRPALAVGPGSHFFAAEGRDRATEGAPVPGAAPAAAAAPRPQDLSGPCGAPAPAPPAGSPPAREVPLQPREHTCFSEQSRSGCARIPGREGSAESRGESAQQHADAGEQPERPGRQLHAAAGSADGKAGELHDVLAHLEALLRQPRRVEDVVGAYRKLSDWTYAHQWDDDLEEVLQKLSTSHDYPPWRRQALEEAYLLFYEDRAQEGNAETLRVLPEPPTSLELGDRRLPEKLMNSRVSRAPLYQNSFEDWSGCLRKQRVEYDIRRTKEGREIQTRDVSERFECPGNDPVRQLLAVFGPSECCSRRVKLQDEGGELPSNRTRRPIGAS